jgi:hypothetical protein
MAITFEQFKEKLKDGTLTVEEAVDYSLSRPDIQKNKSAKSSISALKSGFKKMGLDITMPYKDLQNYEVLKLFSKQFSDANRFRNLQELENVVRPILAQNEIGGYPQLTGQTGTAATQGLGGTQRSDLSGERPMRGLIPKEDIDRIYNQAYEQISDQNAKDALEFHKNTFFRLSHIFGDNAIKVSDITESKDGKTITIKSFRDGNKIRPEVQYDIDSPMGQIIKRQLDQAKETKRPNLFNFSESQYGSVFRKYISPTLLGEFANELPLDDKTGNPVSSGSVVRSFTPRYLLEQFNVPTDIIKAGMGHTEGSTLVRNYAGFVPNRHIANLVANAGLTDSDGGFLSFEDTTSIKLTPEQQADLAEAQAAEARAKTAKKSLEQLEADRERVAFFTSPEGQEYLEGQHKLQIQKLEEEAELNRKKQQLADETKAQRAESKAEEAAKQQSDDLNSRLDKIRKAASGAVDTIKNVGGKALKGVAILGAAELAGRVGSRLSKGDYGGAVAEVAAEVPLLQGPAQAVLLSKDPEFTKIQEDSRQYGTAPVFDIEALFGRGKQEESPQPTKDQMDSLGISPDSSYP